MLQLSDGGLFVVVDADNGGRLCEARINKVSFLRRQLDLKDPDPRNAACFPLVPFSNRIVNGSFKFDGVTYEVPPNLAGEKHTIHGQGWMRRWRVVDHEKSACTLELIGDEWWPWQYSARQIVCLSNGRLDLTLQITNRSLSVMPVGLGFHPYFPISDNTIVKLNAKEVWPPVGAAEFRPTIPSDHLQLSQGRSLSNKLIDHCFDGWSGSATITNPSTGLFTRLCTDFEASRCVVYAPPGNEFICLEPVTHLSGALNMEDSVAAGIRRLEPGGTMSFTISVIPRLQTDC